MDPRFNLIYEMFLSSNLLLLLLWSPSFQYLKGSELNLDSQIPSQTSSNSVSNVHLLSRTKYYGNETSIVSDSTKNDIQEKCLQFHIYPRLLQLNRAFF